MGLVFLVNVMSFKMESGFNGGTFRILYLPSPYGCIVVNRLYCFITQCSARRVMNAAACRSVFVFVGVGERAKARQLSGLTVPDDQRPWRRCFVFNDVLIDVIALCAFECAQIVARFVWFDASKLHFRAALRAWCHYYWTITGSGFCAHNQKSSREGRRISACMTKRPITSIRLRPPSKRENI